MTKAEYVTLHHYMQFSFTGPRALKKMLAEFDGPPLTRSKFILLLVLEGLQKRQRIKDRK